MYGWERMPSMLIDRWYPTMVLLGDGRVLVGAGNSQDPNDDGDTSDGGGNTYIFELFNPAENRWERTCSTGHGVVGTLDCETDAECGGGLTCNSIVPSFPADVNGFENYPFLFLLPDGNVFYAGGEEVTNVAAQVGRVLVVDYVNNNFAWHPERFESNVNGGSAVMFAPGKILKSGGPRLKPNEQNEDDYASAETELIDFSGVSGDPAQRDAEYAAIDKFVAVQPMNQPRHFHNLVVAPDGHVAAIGGNTRGNGEPGDHWDYPCEANETEIATMACLNDGTPDCPSVCTDVGGSPHCTMWRNIGCEVDGDCCPNLKNKNKCPASCLPPPNNPDGRLRCNVDCTMPGSNADCPDPADNAWERFCTSSGVDGAPRHCRPSNVACLATQTAEIFSPHDDNDGLSACNSWAEMPFEQKKPRMYHSTALLMPDGGIFSSGGGKRAGTKAESNTEFFYPKGKPALPPPEDFQDPIDDDDPSAEDEVVLVFGSTEPLHVHVDDPSLVDRVSLVRLGATTHGFDTSQRRYEFNDFITAGDKFLEISLPTTIPIDPDDPVELPTRNILPPGYYMLFLMDWYGRVLGQASYVRLEDPQYMASESWVCPATTTLDPIESSCSTEPIGGVCPAGAVVTNSVPLPRVDGPSGAVDGWYAFAAPGMVEDSTNPSPDEIGLMLDRCVAACQKHFADNPYVADGCDVAGAFATPEPYVADVAGSRDLIHPDHQQGQGLFGTETLSCSLGSSCCSAFDEDVCASAASRPTPAEEQLGTHEEYRVALGGGSTVDIITGVGTFGSTITGSIGYSFCEDGNATAPCPFYLGSFDAVAASNITATLQCDDGTQERHTISNLQVSLGQPAFGMAGTATLAKGFPAAGLVIDAAFDVGRSHFVSRRPNTHAAYMSADGPSFSATNLDVVLQVPCSSGSQAQVTARFNLADPGDGSTLGAPPSASITMNDQVACDGSAISLTANTSDPDADIASVRWRIDDVLLAPGTTSIPFSESHEVKVVVRDSRGATTADRKTVSCIAI